MSYEAMNAWLKHEMGHANSLEVPVIKQIMGLLDAHGSYLSGKSLEDLIREEKALEFIKANRVLTKIEGNRFINQMFDVFEKAILSKNYTNALARVEELTAENLRLTAQVAAADWLREALESYVEQDDVRNIMYSWTNTARQAIAAYDNTKNPPR